MRLLIIFFSILLFSCAGTQDVPSNKLNSNNSAQDASSADIQQSNLTDLTAEIRKFPTVNVKGIGPRASVYLKNQGCKPLFLLNGAIIQDYYTLYSIVAEETIKSVKVVPPRQSAIYGLRASSGVILITTSPIISEVE